MKQITVCLLTSMIFVVGCGGRAANPIQIYRYGDEKKSSRNLEIEMFQVEEEISRVVPKTKKTGKNVALGVTGIFFIVPLFFMDLSQAEQLEVKALRQRYNHLVLLATDKGCGGDREEIPELDKKNPQHGLALTSYMNSTFAFSGSLKCRSKGLLHGI